MRVVFMGTADFAVPCLEKLIEAKYEIVTVVTQPDRAKGRGKKIIFSPIKAIALKEGLNLFQPEKIKEVEAVEYLKNLKPDLIVVVAYGQILNRDILDIPDLGCINVHGSVLPKYRGAAPIHWAIINGETETGVTTMYMDEKLDSGDIILTAKTEIASTDTVGILHDKLAQMGADLLLETIVLIEKGEVKARKQNDAEATYASLLSRDLEKIEWSKSAREICNFIRGMNPWPGAYTVYKDKKIKILEVDEVGEVNSSLTPGTIIKADPEGILIQCGTDAVNITKIQPEGKKAMDSSSYMNGNTIIIGEVLGCD